MSEYIGHVDVSLTLKICFHDSLSPVDVLDPDAANGEDRKAEFCAREKRYIALD